jgi:hypothetical protein
MTEQSFARHRKVVPLYHFFLIGILTINLGWTIFRLFQPIPGTPLPDRIWAVIVAAALGLLAYFARIFALRAQDRVIRLEERLRYETLLPADLKARTKELRRGQFLALRFASDAELDELARAVLDKKLQGADEIKKAITAWRADHFRL